MRRSRDVQHRRFVRVFHRIRRLEQLRRVRLGIRPVPGVRKDARRRRVLGRVGRRLRRDDQLDDFGQTVSIVVLADAHRAPVRRVFERFDDERVSKPEWDRRAPVVLRRHERAHRSRDVRAKPTALGILFRPRV